MKVIRDRGLALNGAIGPDRGISHRLLALDFCQPYVINIQLTPIKKGTALYQAAHSGIFGLGSSNMARVFGRNYRSRFLGCSAGSRMEIASDRGFAIVVRLFSPSYGSCSGLSFSGDFGTSAH